MKTHWENFNNFLKFWKVLKEKRWTWYNNKQCKYIEIRLDTRDGKCLIKDRNGNRVSMEELFKQD